MTIVQVTTMYSYVSRFASYVLKQTDAPHGKALHHLLETRGDKVRSLTLSHNCLKNFNFAMKLIAVGYVFHPLSNYHNKNYSSPISLLSFFPILHWLPILQCA